MGDTRLRLRIYFDDRLQLGPGKADLLDQIAAHGSISAAGRAMGMSYRRAWALVEEMNTAFRDPVVTSSRGGASGGGARLTPTGQQVLDHYRRLQDLVWEQGGDQIRAIDAMLRDNPPLDE
ncbi:winged helix-turn-helix domain-containing protein [Paracoccus jiaweipingae]|uniref:winged helix-turn-helix domain-containing protein n=1 Tax=unclassified Paracoccus (in: a-proteobacteria) TaxID=2688777 RepID=UPI0037BB0A0B